MFEINVLTMRGDINMEKDEKKFYNASFEGISIVHDL